MKLEKEKGEGQGEILQRRKGFRTGSRGGGQGDDGRGERESSEDAQENVLLTDRISHYVHT